VQAPRSRSPHLVRVLHARASSEVTGTDEWAGEDDRWAAEDGADDEAARAPAEIAEEDPLAPARAVIVGLLLVIPMWFMIAGAIYAAYRMFV